MRIDKFTQKMQEAVQSVQSVASDFNQQEITNEHFLLALLDQAQGIATPLLEKMSVPVAELRARLRSEIEKRPRVTGGNVDLHWGDALSLDLGALQPASTKLVANLPYNVATPIVAESLDGLPSLELWCVMVQREVADRFFAAPSTKAYGAVSVLIQLAARRTGFHPVARTVFRPPPNVDSALVAFRRTPLPERFEQIKAVVEASFAHRRKTLPNSLALAGLAQRPHAAAALEAIGRLPETRAEALEPAEFVALTDAL